jgi:hypothetical protein
MSVRSFFVVFAALCSACGPAPARGQALPQAPSFLGDIQRGPDGRPAVVRPSEPLAPASVPEAAAPGEKPQSSVRKPQLSRPAKPEAPQPAKAKSPVQPTKAPPPTMVSNIHNAAAWRHSHSYTVPNAGFPPLRTNNGPGWNEPADRYVPGSHLNSYQLVGPSTPGATCVSAVSGGPSGTGAAITDGTCIWKYVSGVDYISITGWAFDAPSCASLFAAGVVYYHDHCVSGSPLRAYWNTDLTTPAGETCKTPPTGTGTAIAPGDGCTWAVLADIAYSSQRSYMPVQRYLSGYKAAPTVQLTHPYTGNLWNDAVYSPTENEIGTDAGALVLMQHQDFTDDHVSAEYSGGPHGKTFEGMITLQAAPGESFMDYPGGTPMLGGVDQKYGVAIINGHSGGGTDTNSGIVLHDNIVTLRRLQIKSSSAPAVRGAFWHDNVIEIVNCVIESKSNANFFAIECDGGCSIYNNLILGAGAGGVWNSYNGYVSYNTIVSTKAFPESVGVAVIGYSFIPISTYANNAIFGWTHAFVVPVAPGTPFDSLSDRNATDVVRPDPAAGTTMRSPGGFGANGRVADAPGLHSLFALRADAQFKNPASDWRLKSESSLAGAAASLGTITVLGGGVSGSRIYSPDTPDILGTPRPQGGKYDIGAWQSKVAAPR